MSISLLDVTTGTFFLILAVLPFSSKKVSVPH